MHLKPTCWSFSQLQTKGPVSATRTAIRIDIQLLRAVAVLSVIVFHFWPNRLVGGFAGVDVFFVISGFLITALIVREVTATGKLSLVNFWMRRIRRILPAALVVIAATATTVMVIGSSELISSIGRHVFASTFSFENILLAAEKSDYFESENALSPLQHFWSLAVEEQFYVVWPLVVLLVVVATRRATRRIGVLTAVTSVAVIASAVFALWLMLTGDVGAYYNSFARAWELGLGALVAILAARERPLVNGAGATVVNRIAWVLLIASFAVPGLASGVPSWGVAPAVLLTAVIIATGNRVTSRQPNALTRGFVAIGSWVGDRSFSLYLWHWPILILTPYLIGGDLDTVSKLIAIAVAFGLSELTYRFVETPVRVSRAPFLRKATIVGPIAAVTSVALVATVLATSVALTPAPPVPFDSDATNDSKSSFFDENRLILKGIDVTGVAPFCDGAGAWLFDCDPLNDAPVSVADRVNDPCDRMQPCEIGSAASDVTVAFIGDSHARELKTTLDLVGRFLDWRVVSFTMSACPLVHGDTRCDVRNKQFLDRALAGEFDLVITSQSAPPMDSKAAAAGSSDPEADYRDAFAAIVASGTPVATFRDNPSLDDATLRCKRINFDDPNACAMSPDNAYRTVDHAANAAAALGVHVIDMSSIFCRDAVCPMAIGGLHVYRDDDHVTREFNLTLAPFIAADLAGAQLIRTE